MANRPATGNPQLSRRTKSLLVLGAVVLVVLVGLARLVDVYVDWAWFGEVGFRERLHDGARHARRAGRHRGRLHGRADRAQPLRRVPHPAGVRARRGPRGPGRALPHRRAGPPAAVRDRHPADRRDHRRALGAERLGDHPALPQPDAVRRDRPGLRPRHQLLRLRAAVLARGAVLALRRRRGELPRRARRALRLRRHPPGRAQRLARHRRPRPPRRPRRHLRAAQGRRLLLRPLRAALLRPQGLGERRQLLRRELHRPQRGHAGQADPAADRGHLRGRVLRRGVPAQPADPRDRARAADPVQRPHRRRVARGARAVLGAPQRQPARGGLDRAQHRGDETGVRDHATERQRAALRRDHRPERRLGPAGDLHRPGHRPEHPPARPEPALAHLHPARAAPELLRFRAHPRRRPLHAGRRRPRTTSSRPARSTRTTWSATSRTGSTATSSTPTATASSPRRRTR